MKLSVAGKSIVKEEDFDELTSDSFKDYDVSSISGSEEDEPEKGFGSLKFSRASASIRQQKLFIYLQKGERVSVSKCLITNESGPESTLSCEEVIERLKTLVHEPRDKTHLRIVLLASGGHFAGCVFDGNLIVAHKTFHRLAYYLYLHFFIIFLFVFMIFRILYFVVQICCKGQSWKKTVIERCKWKGCTFCRCFSSTS